MPQLDSSFFLSQILWLSISFLILYFLVAKYIVPKISFLFDERKRLISEDIAKAELAKQEAEKIDKKYQNIISQAKEKATEIIELAEKDIKDIKNRNLHELNLELNQELSKFEEKMLKLRNSDCVIDISKEIVKSIYSQILNDSFDEKEIEKYFNDNINKFIEYDRV